ncbi:Uu.00g079490.m01.CDS01 [Anthostomella pinea]|uniref:Uu.00g079490.m01.CDS01 n=1 Tax=Anthostomella pinea TaxID=933095 RepID=A0AAI8VKX0_9PEZI|nr:Uu.00g079490.m01.CDS01 [Anthostomella pinea]
MEPLPLPQDILLLLCQELGARRDFATLFCLSRVSRRVASIALEQLYRVRDEADTFPDGKLQTAQLWRSIVLSSLGMTAYPYCAYVRALSLGHLVECLEEMRPDKAVREFFFDGPMHQFLVLRGLPTRNTRDNSSFLPIDMDRTVVKCVDSITIYIRELADSNGTAVALTHLEGVFIPHDILPTWITRLGTLTSLRLRDGSVLGVEAASAISECCPKFGELVCYYYQSGSADEDMAAFFQTLRPNTLRKFEVLSRNQLGEKSFTALTAHAESLRSLTITSLSRLAMQGLNMLSPCTALEILNIENDRFDSEALSESLVKEVATWISNCKSLRELTLTHVQDALAILKEVMEAPGIHLTTLHVKDFSSASPEVTRAAWASLGLQNRLEVLSINEQDGIVDGLIVTRTPQLTESLCRLKSLSSLDLLQAYVSSSDIRLFATALPNIEYLSFGGDLLDEAILVTLSTIPKLKALSINGTSAFRFDSLKDFAQRLDSSAHQGIRVEILNQWPGARVTEEEEQWLERYFADTLNGRIVIHFPNDPDELHEGDFSDSD